MDYKDYFKKHYKTTFAGTDIKNYSRWFYPQWRFIQSLIEINNKAFVLEIGSGFGGFYNLLPKNIEYIGLELDKAAAEFANSYFSVNCFLNKSIEDFKYRKKFNIVFAFEVFEHLHNPLAVLRKLYSLLKKDGCLCATSPYPYKRNVLTDKTHLYVLHPENWRQLMLRAGFSSVHIYALSFLPLVWRLNKKLNIRIPLYLPLPGFVSTALFIAKK